MTAAEDSPELAAAKWLLDQARGQGFVFQRIAPGEDGPLLGIRDIPEHHDKIYIGGFSSGCTATGPVSPPLSSREVCRSPHRKGMR